MARFQRPALVATVPTTSMADIAFLLLIFFMATTIFKMEEGLPVVLPRAEASQPVPRTRVAHVWVRSAQEMTIDDRFVSLSELAPILGEKLAAQPGLIVGVNIDRSVPWETAGEVIERMKEAHVQMTSFTTDRERP